MRLLLDEHLSGRRIGTHLRRRGHDVEALNEEPAAWGMADEDLLERATASARIAVTCNGRHFMPLARRWASEKRDHAGLLVVWRYGSNAHREIAEAVHAQLVAHPDRAGWTNLVLAA